MYCTWCLRRRRRREADVQGKMVSRPLPSDESDGIVKDSKHRICGVKASAQLTPRCTPTLNRR
jgi:hypothetical protein